MSGTLSIIATPIGNLEDISRRAERHLRGAERVVCEDTRVTGKLLKALGISKPLMTLHEHATTAQVESIVTLLRQGISIAYVCDAGTPGVNDPGGKLVAGAMEAGILVTSVPGPSALTAAISVCGFPMSEFAYAGFAPHKKGRDTFFRHIADSATPTVFFESTHRIEKTLASLKAVLDPARLVFVGRELTKIHETLYRGPIDEVIRRLHDTSLKGEFVIILAPKHFV